MIYHIFSVFDYGAEHYMTPFYVENEKLAVRMFSDICQDSDSAIARHPSDFSLFCLGSFNNCSGDFNIHPQPELVSKAVSFVDSRSAADHIARAVVAASDS
ncbi:MAG: DNA binding protein [Microviridae sp. ct0DW36]|nr:MAG: DNA binding protein [Microviridae sp. ct0DW36]